MDRKIVSLRTSDQVTTGTQAMGAPPTPLQPATYWPGPFEIYWQRFVCGKLNTREKVAEVCHVHPETVRNWEKGRTPMHPATWSWLRVYTSGGLLAGGPGWDGWRMWPDGDLESPTGRCFQPGDIQAIPTLIAQNRELQREKEQLQNRVQELEAEVSRFRPAADAPSRPYHRGQLDALGLVFAILKGEFENSSDEVVSELAETLDSAAYQTAQATVSLVRSEQQAG